MKSIPYSTYLLPNPIKGKKPYKSTFKMNAQEAASRGALEIVAGTTEIRQVPETEEERRRAMVHYPSAGQGGVVPPRS